MDVQPSTLASRLRAFPRPVWILFFGTFLNKFGTFVIPFLSLYMTRQGFSLTQAGLAVSSYGVGTLLASLLGGQLADTLGRRNTIVCSMFTTSAAMMLLSQAHSFWAIVATTCVVGLTGELYRPASSALLADLVPMGERVTAFSAYRLAFNAGWAFGPATAGFLAGHSYLWLFVGDAATSALFGVVALVALPRGWTASKAERGWLPVFRAVGRDRKYLRLLCAAAFIALVFFQMSSTFSLQVTGLGFSPTTYGALISFNGVLVVCCELPLTTFTRRWPARRVIAAGYVLIGTGFGLIAFAHTVPLLALAVLVFTFGEMTTMPVSSAYVADLAPLEYRGRYIGVMGLTWAVALIFGPALGMWVFTRNPVVLWTSCAGLAALSVSIILAGRE